MCAFFGNYNTITMATPYSRPRRGRSTPPVLRAKTPVTKNMSSRKQQLQQQYPYPQLQPTRHAPTPPPMIVTQQKISNKLYSTTTRARLQRQARLKLQQMDKEEPEPKAGSYLPSTLALEKMPQDPSTSSSSSEGSPESSSTFGTENKSPKNKNKGYASYFANEMQYLEDAMDGFLGKVAQLDQSIPPRRQATRHQNTKSLVPMMDETTIISSSSFGGSTTEYYRQILDTSDTFSQEPISDEDNEEPPMVTHKNSFDLPTNVHRHSTNVHRLLPPLPPRPHSTNFSSMRGGPQQHTSMITKTMMTTTKQHGSTHRRTMSHDTAVTMNSSYSGETHDSLPSAEQEEHKQSPVLLSSSMGGGLLLSPPPVVPRQPTPMGAFVEDASSCEGSNDKDKDVVAPTKNSVPEKEAPYDTHHVVPCGKPGAESNYPSFDGMMMMQGPPQMCSEIVLQDPQAWKNNKHDHKTVATSCQTTPMGVEDVSEKEENSMIVPSQQGTPQKDKSSYDRFFNMAVMCGGMDNMTSAATIHGDAKTTKDDPQKAGHVRSSSTTFAHTLQSKHSTSEESTVNYEKAREHPIFSSNTGDSSDDGASAESPELHPDSTNILHIFTNSFGTPEDSRHATPNTTRNTEVPMTPNRVGLEIPAFPSPTSINQLGFSPSGGERSSRHRQRMSPSRVGSKSPEGTGLTSERIGLDTMSQYRPSSTIGDAGVPVKVEKNRRVPFPIYIKEPYVEPKKTISLTDDEEDESIRSTFSSDSESSYESYLTSESEASSFSDEYDDDESTRSASSVEHDSEDDQFSNDESSGSFRMHRGRQRVSDKTAVDSSRSSNSNGGTEKELPRNTTPLSLNFIKLLALPDLPPRQRQQLERRRGTSLSAFFGKSNADKALAIQCKATDSFLAEITCHKSRTILGLTLENCNVGGAGTGIKSISLFCPNDSEEGEPSFFLSRDSGPSTVFGPLPYPLYMRFHRNGFDPKTQVKNIEYLSAGPMEYYFCQFYSGDTWWGSRAEDAPFHKICSSWDIHTASFGTPVVREKKREASWILLSCDGQAAWRNLPARLHNILLARTELVSSLVEKGTNYFHTCASEIAEISLGSEDSYFVRFMDGSVDFCYSAKMEKHHRHLEEKGSTVTSVCLHPQLPFNFVMRSSH